MTRIMEYWGPLTFGNNHKCIYIHRKCIYGYDASWTCFRTPGSDLWIKNTSLGVSALSLGGTAEPQKTQKRKDP